MARGKHADQVVVAIARELVGFIWAIAKQVPVTLSGQPDTGRLNEQLRGFPTCIRRDAARVWCHPRRREEAERNPRASSEAGT
jgi:hypothetical protein